MWLVESHLLEYSLLISLHVTEQLSLLAPSECPHLILQALAGPMAAATASTITNPMDVVRARVQVKPVNRERPKLLELQQQLVGVERLSRNQISAHFLSFLTFLIYQLVDSWMHIFAAALFYITSLFSPLEAEVRKQSYSKLSCSAGAQGCINIK